MGSDNSERVSEKLNNLAETQTQWLIGEQKKCRSGSGTAKRGFAAESTRYSKLHG